MKSVYERSNLIITEFRTDDVIVTSGITPVVPDPPAPAKMEKENAYGKFSTFAKSPPSGWF